MQVIEKKDIVSHVWEDWTYMIQFIEFFECEIAKILSRDHVSKTDIKDFSEDDLLDLGLSIRKHLDSLPAVTPPALKEDIKKNADQLFAEFSNRRAFLKYNSPEEAFEKIFKTPSKKKIWVEAWLHSLHFYLQDEDFLVAYKGWKNAGGVCMQRAEFGVVTITRIKKPYFLADLNKDLLLKYGIYAKNPYGTDRHERQHARYRAILGGKSFWPSCVRKEDVLDNSAMASLTRGAINEIFAHVIETRDTAEIRWRLMGMEYVVDTLGADSFTKNSKQMSVSVFSLWYEYRRVIGNCIDFVDDIVRSHWSERQKWIDKLTITPIIHWHELQEGWKPEDFLMNFKWLGFADSGDIHIEEKCFEKFPFPVRVVNPPNQDCDIVVAIPSYNEDTEIIHALESIADQTINTRNNKISVFVVLNQSPDASDKVDQSNKRTAQLLNDIWRGELTQEYSKREERKIRKIFASWLHISIIDLYSEWQSHTENNVGFARDVGGWTATEYLHDPSGYMVQIDADTLLDPTYLDCINWDNPGQSGNVVFRKDKTTETANELDAYLWDYNRILRNLHTSTFSRPTWYMEEYGFMDGYKSLFSGCNIVVNKQVFRDVGGFDHISGAEDVLFGMKVNAHVDSVEWYRSSISYNEDLTVYPKYRPSDRTQKGHGHWHEVIRKMQYSLWVWEFPVEQHTAYLEKIGLTKAIETANHLELEKAGWMKFVRGSCLPALLLSDEEISNIFELSLKSNRDDPVHLNHHLERCIEDIVGEQYPKVPLEQSLDNIFVSLLQDNPIAERLFSPIVWNNIGLKEKTYFLKNIGSDLFQDLLRVSEMRDCIQFVSTTFKKEEFKKDCINDTVAYFSEMMLIYLNTHVYEIAWWITRHLEPLYKIDTNALLSEMYLNESVKEICTLTKYGFKDKNDIVLSFWEIFGTVSSGWALRSMSQSFHSNLEKMQQDQVDEERIDMFVYINLLAQKILIKLSEDIYEKKRPDVLF
jgi:hypothetical protein